MLLYDIVYGKHQIREHILIDLINSRAVQRLRGIAQLGVPDEWYHIKLGLYRFDHSIGVLILLDIMNASLEEKIAGILHDISHTVFSHVIDFVYGSERDEDFQDKILPKFMDSPEIKIILQKYDFRSGDFHDLTKFTLLEQEIPDLCADRIDYCLREMKMNGLDNEVRMCLDSFVNIDGRICIKSEEAALLFAREYKKCSTINWGSEQARNRYRILGDIIKIAMSENIVTFEDLLTEDRFVMEKLMKSENLEIKKGIENLVTGNFEIRKNIPKKLRYVDPLYLENGVVKRLSETNSDFLNEINSLKMSHS